MAERTYDGQPCAAIAGGAETRRACYRCQGCGRVVDWQTDEVVEDPDALVRSIASRYCWRCVVEEAEASGLPVAQVVEHRLAQGRPV